MQDSVNGNGAGRVLQGGLLVDVDRDAVPACVAGLTAAEPPWRQLPSGRAFSAEFLALREGALVWLEPYYDRVHLTRAADWMLVVAPDAPEHLVLAALMHDLERSI